MILLPYSAERFLAVSNVIGGAARQVDPVLCIGGAGARRLGSLGHVVRDLADRDRHLLHGRSGGR